MLSGFMVLKQVAPTSSRRGRTLCVPDVGASSRLNLTLPLRTDKVISRLLKVSMRATGR